MEERCGTCSGTGDKRPPSVLQASGRHFALTSPLCPPPFLSFPWSPRARCFPCLVVGCPWVLLFLLPRLGSMLHRSSLLLPSRHTRGCSFLNAAHGGFFFHHPPLHPHPLASKGSPSLFPLSHQNHRPPPSLLFLQAWPVLPVLTTGPPDKIHFTSARYLFVPCSK